MSQRYLPSPTKGPRTFVNRHALVWAETILGVPTGPKSLLLFLARKADAFGCCFYRKDTLAAHLGCSSRSVQTHIRHLEGHGLIRTIGRRNTQKQISNVYHVIGWPSRERLPQSGHPILGRYVTEPKYADLREALHKQNLLQLAENSAHHNNNTEIFTTLGKEDVVETCIVALGTWITAREQDLLRNDYLILLHLIEQGYGVEAHILPVLRKKAETRRKAHLIRTWDYFGDAIAEYVAKIGAELDEAFRKAPQAKPVRTDPKEEQDRAALRQIYSRVKRTPSDTGSDGGSE